MKYNEVLSMFPVHKGCVTKYTSKHGPKDMSLSRLPAWFEKLSRGFFFYVGKELWRSIWVVKKLELERCQV